MAQRNKGILEQLAEEARIISPYLVLTRGGDKNSHSNIQSVMSRIKKRIREVGKEKIYWTIHNLTRKK